MSARTNTGEKPAAAAAQEGIQLEVVEYYEAKHGFVLLPRRLVVEQSFAWAARFRRLPRDYERLPAIFAGYHWLAFVTLMFSALFMKNYDSYQWYLNSKPVKGQIYSALIFPTITSKNTGVHKVAVSSGGPPVMSQGALLQVVTPVTIKKQPAPVFTAKTGKGATFRVIALGTRPLYYQWYADSNAIPNAQASEAGQYCVKVQNRLTWNVSDFAMITVTP